MKAVGIIAEYNPFHNGHLYHIEQARALTGADAVIVVMSGNFVQRGEPAIIDKYQRAAMALSCGADAVLELPVSWATGTAERFAEGGVHVLHSLGPVTDLVYGSECPDSSLWQEITDLLSSPSDAFTVTVNNLLKTGCTYPAARARAMEDLIPGASELLSSPNNILALEYRRAIAAIPNCRLIPHEILRRGSGYSQDSLPEPQGQLSFPSATAIRKALTDGLPIPENCMPEAASALMNYSLSPDSLSSCLRYALLTQDTAQLASRQDMNPDLANRLISIFREHPEYSFTQFAEALKSRNITRTRANRALLHTVLQIQESGRYPAAVRLLGFRPGSRILREIMDQTEIPVITKMADAPAGVFDEDIRASHLYNQLVFEHTGIQLPDEYRRGPVR